MGTNWKKLKAHFEGLGAAAKFVEIGYKGSGGAVFASAEEAAAAIAAVNGQDIRSWKFMENHGKSWL